ncbi:hypothetical protein A2U01_0094692, partial [Trifolium medium]|nr:hypothetical protein [Trifolium medium]
AFSLVSPPEEIQLVVSFFPWLFGIECVVLVKDFRGFGEGFGFGISWKWVGRDGVVG